MDVIKAALEAGKEPPAIVYEQIAKDGQTKAPWSEVVVFTALGFGFWIAYAQRGARRQDTVPCRRRVDDGHRTRTASRSPSCVPTAGATKTMTPNDEARLIAAARKRRQPRVCSFGRRTSASGARVFAPFLRALGRCRRYRAGGVRDRLAQARALRRPLQLPLVGQRHRLSHRPRRASRAHAQHSARHRLAHTTGPRRAKPTRPLEDRIALADAMAQLPDDQRAAVALCLGEGFSHSEAAVILKLPLGTVKSHVTRGRERLLARVGAQHG